MDKFPATITIHEDFCDKLFYYHNFNMLKYHSKRWCTTMEAGKRLRAFSPRLIKEARVFLPLSPFQWKYRVHLRDIFVPGKRQVSPEAGQWLHFLELVSMRLPIYRWTVAATSSWMNGYVYPRTEITHDRSSRFPVLGTRKRSGRRRPPVAFRIH